MKRVIIHWTVGCYQPNQHEYERYHYLVNGDGVVVKGKYKPEDNLNCNDGKYAAHTGGGNTGSIGIALCGMLGYREGIPTSTKYPLKFAQCEAAWKKIAEICKVYNIPITSETVLTHYEFGKSHPNTTSRGKIDINYLHPYPQYKAQEIGNFIRGKVLWYYSKYYKGK